jgi:hypothetical protein
MFAGKYGALDWDGKVIPIRQGLLDWIVTSEDGRWLMTMMQNQDAQSGVDATAVLRECAAFGTLRR